MTNAVCDVQRLCTVPVFPPLSPHITNQHVLRLSIYAKLEQQNRPFSWKLISKHRVMHSAVGFGLDSLLHSQKRERIKETGYMDRWIGFNESLFLPKAVTLTSKSGLSEEMSAHTKKIWKTVATRADGDLQLCVALRYCYCSSRIYFSADEVVNDTAARGQGCQFLKMIVNQLVFHIYGRHNNSLHYNDIKYSEYMGSNKDSYAWATAPCALTTL